MATLISVRNPRTGDMNYKTEALNADDLAQIAKELRAAQVSWNDLGLEHRIHHINWLANEIEKNSEYIAGALEVDTGRRSIAKQEVMGVVGSLRGWAMLAPTLINENKWVQGRTKANFKHRNQYVPYSLVGVISPWNFPMTLSFIDTIPALLAGACVMVKPSEVTPRFADALSGSIKAAGMENVLRFVQGDGRTGAALIDQVDCVCFTGSVATGQKVAVAAAKNLIPANLELGGKDPLIITESADMDIAASLALRSTVLATGQACQSIERVYVPNSKLEVFLKLLVPKANAATLNIDDIEQGQIGPFIFGKQAGIVKSHIDDAAAKGAILHCGGEILDHGGHWMAPTVLSNVDHTMDVMTEETFGPVIPVMGYNTIKDAIKLANDTQFGLSGAVYAGSIEEAEGIGAQINAGAISLMDASLTGQYFEAAKQSFKNSGLGPSRMGEDGFFRFFQKKALIANTVCPLTLEDF